MDSLTHLFLIIIVYPALNVLVWFYLQIHNFALAIIFFSCFRTMCIGWPAQFLTSRGKHSQSLQQQLEEVRRQYPENQRAQRDAIDRLYKRYDSMSSWYRLIYVWLPRFLVLLSWYFLFGMYFALVVLGGSSLQMLNGALYPMFPHLTTLPDYTFAFLGQTVSLVQRGILPALLIPIALIALVSAYLSMKQSVVLPMDGQCKRGCTFFLAALMYPLIAALAIIMAWLFAAGTLLDIIASSLLGVVENIVVFYLRSRSERRPPGDGHPL